MLVDYERWLNIEDNGVPGETSLEIMRAHRSIGVNLAPSPWANPGHSS